MMMFLAAAAVIQVSFIMNGKNFRAVLSPDIAEPLTVYRGKVVIASGARRSYHPWKLDVADVDGDKKPDLCIGVKKSTRKMPVPHTSLFVYGFDGKRISKKWLGSSMGRSLLDFCFGPKAKNSVQPLYTLETRLGGAIALSKYGWSGFGFYKRDGELAWPNASNLAVERGKITLTISGKRATLSSEDLPWKN